MDKIQKINQDFYNKNALAWASTKANSVYDEYVFRKFIKYFKPNDLILDIGCGHGRNIPLFLGIGRKLKYEGLDISSALLKIAKSRYPQLSFYYRSILNKRKLPKKQYDGFWAAASLQHIPEKDWPFMLENIEYLLKTRGVGYISLSKDRPNPESKTDPRHFNLFSYQKFKKIVSKRGWKILDYGKLLSTQRTNVWLWFIVQLPKS